MAMAMLVLFWLVAVLVLLPYAARILRAVTVVLRALSVALTATLIRLRMLPDTDPR